MSIAMLVMWLWMRAQTQPPYSVIGTEPISPPYTWTEIDVPAVQELHKEPNVWSEANCEYNNVCPVRYDAVRRWTCSDRRRVLLTDESGKRHCILFREAR